MKPHHPSDRPRRRSDGGSATTELVLLTPLLVAILGVFFFAGRIVLARQDVDDAARTALDAAVMENDGIGATNVAALTTLVVLGPDHGLCGHVSSATDASHFTAGGVVWVRVACVVQFPNLAFTGLPTSVTITSSRGAVLEPYREVGP